MSPTTLQEAIIHFVDESVCRDFVARLRWPNGVACPRCGTSEVTWLKTRNVWQCRPKGCRRQFSVKVGTIFEDSPIPLSKWLPAIWLITSAKNGISSYELHRALGVTQKSAWFMLHRVRLAMQEGSVEPFRGEVEADETFIGGKARFMHRSKRAAKITGTGGTDKTVVMGVLERDGGRQRSSRVRAEVIPNRRRASVQGPIREHVAPGAAVYTDALGSYGGLHDEYVHGVVDHAEEYVNGRVHTNGIENFWSFLKRSIGGTYVSVEPAHLLRYVDEQVCRFNTRADGDGERFTGVVGHVTGRRLTYEELTGSPAAS